MSWFGLREWLGAKLRVGNTEIRPTGAWQRNDRSSVVVTEEVYPADYGVCGSLPHKCDHLVVIGTANSEIVEPLLQFSLNQLTFSES